MSRLLNGVLLALVAVAYGLWFGLRLLGWPFAWLWQQRPRSK
ncbi:MULTISPECIES: hypothetical protein [unclassified Paludibacterium]|nr:hypothetical protein [Paludibacterium sp. B53371]